MTSYYYMDFLGGVIFSTSFDQFFGWFLSGFWWLWVVSWSHFWQLMIYHIWQLYMRANFPNNPAGNDINFRIITSLHLPILSKFLVYDWVPRILLSLGIQGQNHHECMVSTITGKRPTTTSKRPTITVNRAWTERETLGTIFLFGSLGKIIPFLDGNRHEFALRKLRNVKLERPIRGCDLKVIEKNCASNHASTVSNGFQIKFSIEPIQSSVVICGSNTIKLWAEWRTNVEKSLATMNVRGKRAELYQTEVNQRSS